jgi:hypothetical protein
VFWKKWVFLGGFLWWSCGELRGESWWIDGRFSGAKNMPLNLNFLVEISEDFMGRFSCSSEG